MSQYWWEADCVQLYSRMSALEAELSVAARLLEVREERVERAGGTRSDVVTELQQKWRALLDEKPQPKMEEAA